MVHSIDNCGPNLWQLLLRRNATTSIFLSATEHTYNISTRRTVTVLAERDKAYSQSNFNLRTKSTTLLFIREYSPALVSRAYPFMDGTRIFHTLFDHSRKWCSVMTSLGRIEWTNSWARWRKKQIQQREKTPKGSSHKMWKYPQPGTARPLPHRPWGQQAGISSRRGGGRPALLTRSVRYCALLETRKKKSWCVKLFRNTNGENTITLGDWESTSLLRKISL